ncbi:flagellar protein FliT [Immundisolibacter sp.]|uniref:flagellar protein FliT n=1 Tax=Immundisolibacter sp. TaxID=1934948 RepID=UPI000EC53A42|nr:hypothetical protein [Gammaproteobacteria bacterium]
MNDTALQSALALTAAMLAAADADAWDEVAALAARRHACLQAALGGDAWRLRSQVVQDLRHILAADRQLAERASAARRQATSALRELRGGTRMQDVYAANAALG